MDWFAIVGGEDASMKYGDWQLRGSAAFSHDAAEGCGRGEMAAGIGEPSTSLRVGIAPKLTRRGCRLSSSGSIEARMLSCAVVSSDARADGGILLL